MSKRDSAIALAKRGFRVFRLTVNGKHGFEGWQQEATTDPDAVRKLWTGRTGNELPYNIGIAPDAGLLVFDEDVSEGKRGDKSRELLEAIYDSLPETFTVLTARGGRHRYYRTHTPVANSASKVGTHIDIKSAGGLVVGPGSVVDGAPYVIETDAPIADAPQWLIDMAGAPHERNNTDAATPLVELDSPSAIARGAEWLDGHAPESGTYAVACKVRAYGVSRDVCLDLMMEHWPPAEAKGEDHVSFRVDNAYQYAQDPPGIASAEAEFGAVEIDQTKPSPKKGLHYIAWKDAVPDFEQPYLIDGILDMATMAVTYGDSNTGKTYVKLDQAFHIAAGIDWNGHKVKQGAVVYIAAEGGRGFSRRVAAFTKHYGVKELPFAIVPCAVDLFSEQGDTAKMFKLKRQVEADFGQKCVLVVVDTLARAMAGGDESTSKDMGQFVRNCDRLREATGATVNIIHHTGKDKAKGARGSSALRAATDTEIEIDVGTMAVTKQRDMAKGEELRFKLQTVEIGYRSDGKAVTACVVEWVAANEFDSRVSPVAMQMLGVLEQMIAAEQDRIEEETGTTETNKSDIRIAWQEWQLSLLACLKGARGKSVNRTTLFGFRRELSESGLVKKDKNNQWFIP